MSTWESEMTSEEWEKVMGVSYSHISLDEQKVNRQFNLDMVQNLLDKLQVNWEAVAKEWCSCELDPEELYALHIPPNKRCAICKSIMDNDHYHCGVCSKVCLVG